MPASISAGMAVERTPCNRQGSWHTRRDSTLSLATDPILLIHRRSIQESQSEQPRPRAQERPPQHAGVFGTPGETRTPNLLIRSQTLYPIELRVHVVGSDCGHNGSTAPPVGRSRISRQPSAVGTHCGFHPSPPRCVGTRTIHSTVRPGINSSSPEAATAT